MNTAATRKLALGDRVVWIDRDGYRPNGLGTITRITAYEVEVRWDAEPRVAVVARTCMTFDMCGRPAGHSETGRL